MESGSVPWSNCTGYQSLGGAHGAFRRGKLGLSEGIVAEQPEIVAPEPRVARGSLPTLIVYGNGSRGALYYRNPKVTEGNLLVAVGSVMAVVGLANLAVQLFPAQLDVGGWWFTLSRSLTTLPTTMIALVLIAYGLLRRGTPAVVMRVVAAGLAIISAFLVTIGLVYIVGARSMASGATRDAMGSTKTIVMNSIEIVAYPIGLLGMAAILWYGVTARPGQVRRKGTEPRRRFYETKT
jgi:hypothetical protein